MAPTLLKKLVDRNLAINGRLRLEMERLYDPFFCIVHDHFVVTVFQLSQVEGIEVLFAAEVLCEKNVFAFQDAYRHGASLGVVNGDTELQRGLAGLVDADLQVRRNIAAGINRVCGSLDVMAVAAFALCGSTVSNSKYRTKDKCRNGEKCTGDHFFCFFVFKTG